MSSLSGIIHSLQRLDKLLSLEDLICKGGCRIQCEDEKDMKAKELKFKRLGLKASSSISGPSQFPEHNEYVVYVSLN